MRYIPARAKWGKAFARFAFVLVFITAQAGLVTHSHARIAFHDDRASWSEPAAHALATKCRTCELSAQSRFKIDLGPAAAVVVVAREERLILASRPFIATSTPIHLAARAPPSC